MEFLLHTQTEPLGLGHAILQSLDSINGPCLILLGDNIITDNFSSINSFQPSTASRKLISSYMATSLPCAGIYSIARNEVSSYGVIELDGDKITNIVEKPDLENAPSNKVLVGGISLQLMPKNCFLKPFQFVFMENFRLLSYRNIG